MKTTKNIVRIAATALAAMSFAAALSIPTFAAAPELIGESPAEPALMESRIATQKTAEAALGSSTAESVRLVILSEKAPTLESIATAYIL